MQTAATFSFTPRFSYSRGVNELTETIIPLLRALERQAVNFPANATDRQLLHTCRVDLRGARG